MGTTTDARYAELLDTLNHTEYEAHVALDALVKERISEAEQRGRLLERKRLSDVLTDHAEDIGGYAADGVAAVRIVALLVGLGGVDEGA